MDVAQRQSDSKLLSCPTYSTVYMDWRAYIDLEVQHDLALQRTSLVPHLAEIATNSREMRCLGR